MHGLSETEIAAIQAGANEGGQYLDSIKQTDLARMTSAQWMTFVERIVCGALDYLQRQSEKNIPF